MANTGRRPAEYDRAYRSGTYNRPMRNSYAARQQEFQAPKFYQIEEEEDDYQRRSRNGRSGGAGRSSDRRRSGRRNSSQRNAYAGSRSGSQRVYDGNITRMYPRGNYGDAYDAAYERHERRRGVRRKQKRKYVFTTTGKVGNGYMDFNLLMCILFLVVFGLVMLYSTSYYSATINLGNGLYYFKRQALISLGGLGVMYVISRINYHFWIPFASLAYLGSLVLVVLLLTPLGITKNEATRWLGVTESVSFQPAEVCKIAVIVFIPAVLMKMNRKFSTLKSLCIVWGFGFIPFALIFLISSNLSSATIVFGITAVMTFIVFPKLWPFLSIGAVGSVGLFAFIRVIILQMENSENFRFRRIIAWLNPEKYASDLSYQTMQALYAIGSGGLFGKGLGNSTQKMIIPEAQNDMIFSVICEELGMFGVAIVVFLFGVLLYRLMLVANNAPDFYGSMLVIGIFAHIAIQVVLNIAVVTNVIPNTGITLPFISYGGTSVALLLAEMGLALNVSRQIEWKD